MMRSALLLALSLVLLSGCRARPDAEPSPLLPVHDVHSFARPADARVAHVSLDLRVDFDTRTIAGTATLRLERHDDASEVVLDTRGLQIAAVRDNSRAELKWQLGPPDDLLGQPLVISLGAQTSTVVVEYTTSPDAAALQWLAPEQTAGKRHPYLYSQGQAILTRTWIPTQDSPGIRQTFDARITVPAPLVAVMAAEMLTPEGKAAADGARTFEFRLDQPVPPYLFALAVGDLAFRQLGPRTGVYTEPGVIDRAAAEFVDVEAMITAAESIGGPYRWGRYDLLVLPPSFPFGGMENPRLTFATPTILAGDRSLVSLVAHELAHSWSGNLVTNATWGDFWLNEGFTSYFENRIMETLYGPARATMLAQLGYADLRQALATLPAADTVLALDLTGRDPDDAMNAIAYDKGAALLFTIEHAVGRERFDPYLRGYFNRHAFRPVSTLTFLADLREHLIQGDRQLEERLQLQAWLFEPGLPDNAYEPASEAFTRVEAQADAFAKGDPASTIAASAWTPQEWQHFLQQLLGTSLTATQMRDLDATFALTNSGNSEVLFSWLRVAIVNRYEPAWPALERFLTEQGRRKFLRPLYEDLMGRDWGQPMARAIYLRARPGYHSVATGTLDGIVK